MKSSSDVLAPSEALPLNELAANLNSQIIHRSLPLSPVCSQSVSCVDCDLPSPPLSCLTSYDTSPFPRLSDHRAMLAQQRVRLEHKINKAIGQTPPAISDDRDLPVVTKQHFPSHDGRCAYTYTGPIHPETRLPHGTGEIEYCNGQVYRGSLRQGLRHGYGDNKWPTADGQFQVYRGTWENDSRHGRGTHAWIDKSGDRPKHFQWVTGYWKNGHVHGRVCMEWPDGSTYDGDVEDGKKHGRGIQTWKSGKVYSGQYRDGSEEGYGTLTDVKKQTTYRGHFKGGKRDGTGVQMWRSKTYDGQWVDNVIQGHGTLTWRNGTKYTGHFDRGKFHGNGCLTDRRGDKYIGSFCHGKKEGAGKEFFVNGDVFSGAFANDLRNGYGRLTLADGNMFAGGWYQGKKSGRGIQISKDGKVEHCGVFADDEPLSFESSSDLKLNDFLNMSYSTTSLFDLDDSTSTESKYVTIEGSDGEQVKLSDNQEHYWSS